ncbi:hypothetical protein Tco_0793926, partial [Tanacetum coccineum]
RKVGWKYGNMGLAKFAISDSTIGDGLLALSRMTNVIKREFEKLEDLYEKDVSLTYGTSLKVFNNEFNRMSEMDDDLFTYEVEVAKIPCDSNKDDDLEHEADDDMGYDPSDVIRGDDEVELTDEESFDDEDEVAEVFRIDTNLFDFETPMFLNTAYSSLWIRRSRERNIDKFWWRIYKYGDLEVLES